MADDQNGSFLDKMGDKVVAGARAASGKIFNWTDDEHKQAADYADRRAQELRDTQNGPRMFKGDLSGHIKALEDTAAYHRSQLKNGNSSQQSSSPDSGAQQVSSAFRRK